MQIEAITGAKENGYKNTFPGSSMINSLQFMKYWINKLVP
jgi:hypothetical protein